MCVCFGHVIYRESLLRIGQGLRQSGVCGCGSFRTLGKENFVTGLINTFVYLGEQPLGEPTFKALVCSSHLHPFLTLILSQLPAEAASCICQTLPFQTAGQNTFLCSKGPGPPWALGLVQIMAG